MKGRLLLTAGVVVVLGVVGVGVIFWLASPKHNITKEAFDQIEVGWPEDRVERLLGVSAGSYAAGRDTLYDAEAEFFIDGDCVTGRELLAAGGKEWGGDEFSVFVRFDALGRVEQKRLGMVSQGEPFLHKIRRLLHLP